MIFCVNILSGIQVIKFEKDEFPDGIKKYPLAG